MKPRQTALRVLLVDDDPGVRAAGRRLMKSAITQLQIGEAFTAEEALAAIAAQSWDVVLLDIRLPGRNGLEVLPEIRTAQPALPVVVWTALHPEIYRDKALAAGAAAFVAKERAAEDLVDAIVRVTERAEVATEKTDDIEHHQRQAVAALGRPESFQLLVESVRDYAIFMLSPDGVVLTWTQGAEQITGWSGPEIVGKHVSFLHLPETNGAQDAARELAAAAANGRCELEGWRMRRGRPPFWAFIVTTALRDQDGALRGFAKVIRDETERKRHEASNARFMDELERSNRDLESFASVASHDLQEPLRKILTFADRLTVRFGAQLPEGSVDYIDRVTAAARRMQQLIDALLVYSRVTAKAPAFVPVALSKIAEDVVNDLEARIVSSGGRVEVEPLPTIDADATQMRQLLQNLVGNGLKFHRASVPPTVRVSARVEGDRCELVVADDGIGFEPIYAERIFGVFQRLHGRSAYDGAGIGLAVCKRIVERHGGAIVALGVPDGGARFVVTLPLRHASHVKGST